MPLMVLVSWQEKIEKIHSNIKEIDINDYAG